MTKPQTISRTGCSALALATGLLMAPSPVSAQSFDASGVVVEGQAQIIDGLDTTDIIVESNGVVIDWTPNNQAGGGDILFQPFGTTATFVDDGIITDFAVLNRILPSDISRRIVFDGTVVSEIQGQVDGTVFFYSPGGILVGNDAVFDVGNLGLTTADPVTDGNGNFITGNQVTFQQSTSTSSITIDPGAGIFAEAPGSYVALFAPRIINRGLISTGGQAALVGAEAGTITFSPDGLFDIQVSVGSEFVQPIENTGIIGGPATADGSGRVYMVAISKNSAATIAIAGGSSLGFDVANSAFMDGDTVVLSAGFNVTGGEIEATEQKLEVWAQKHELKKLHKALKTHDYKIRLAAIRHLAQIRSSDSTTHLEALIDDPFLSVLQATREALMSIDPAHPAVAAFDKKVEEKTQQNEKRKKRTEENFMPHSEEEEREKLLQAAQRVSVAKIYQKADNERQGRNWNWLLATLILGAVSIILWLLYF